MGTQFPQQKNGHNPHPIFGPCLLWLNGWMDQDATWYGGKTWPRRRCVKRGPSSPRERGTAAPLFWPMSIVSIAHLLSSCIDMLWYSTVPTRFSEHKFYERATSVM